MPFRRVWTNVLNARQKRLKLALDGAEDIPVAPFHPLRYETRAFVARALAAFAVFCAIALAGTGVQIASAEAKKDKGAAEGTGVVLQDGQNTQPEQTGNGNGNGNGWGKGGADKAD